MTKLASNKKHQNLIIMYKNWYVYILIAVVAWLLMLLCDKFKIIKSKPLRIFVVIFIASIICWGCYDLIV